MPQIVEVCIIYVCVLCISHNLVFTKGGICREAEISTEADSRLQFKPHSVTIGYILPDNLPGIVDSTRRHQLIPIVHTIIICTYIPGFEITTIHNLCVIMIFWPWSALGSTD